MQEQCVSEKMAQKSRKIFVVSGVHARWREVRTEGIPARTEAVITGEMASGALGALKGDADGVPRHLGHTSPLQ